jgi:hypothetical protein
MGAGSQTNLDAASEAPDRHWSCKNVVGVQHASIDPFLGMNPDACIRDIQGKFEVHRHTNKPALAGEALAKRAAAATKAIERLSIETS